MGSNISVRISFNLIWKRVSLHTWKRRILFFNKIHSCFDYRLYFYQWSYVYMRNTGFAKRVIWNALSVVTGGIVNITMCYLSINKYGEWGVVLSFILSYIVMLVTSWGINEWIIREYVPKFRLFFNPLIIWGMFVLAYYMVYELLTNNYVEEFFLKLLLCIIYCFCVIFPYRNRICSVLKRKK